MAREAPIFFVFVLMENIGFLNRNRVVLTVNMIFVPPAASQNHNFCVQQFYNVQSYSQKMLTHGLGRAPSVLVSTITLEISSVSPDDGSSVLSV